MWIKSLIFGLEFFGLQKQVFFVENGAVQGQAGGSASRRSNQPDRDEIVAPGGLVVNSVDEVPPPSYTTVTGGTPVVTCRVCQVSNVIQVYLNKDKDKGSNDETKNTHLLLFSVNVCYVVCYNIVFQFFEILQ